jgi:hypothetical protein
MHAMPIPTTLATLALLVAVGGAGGVGLLYVHNQRLEERLAALESSQPATEAEGRNGGAAPGLGGTGMRRDVAELQGLSEGLVQRMHALERREPEAAVPVGEQVAALTGSASFNNAVRDVLLDMATNDVDFRARIGTGQQTEIPKNAPFSRVADVLKLDASQEDRLRKDLQSIQEELIALLSEERDDGVVPLELIAKADELKPGDPRRAEIFSLLALKIPGGEETYLKRLVKLQTEFSQRSRKYLRPEQNEIWDSIKVDWFSIKFN